MTIEETIKILDPKTSRNALLKYKEGEQRLEACNEACRIAASALRAQQTTLDRSRWEGCNFCSRITDKGADAAGCSFCPACGRPLTGEAWAELERGINDGTADMEKRD